MINQTTLQGNWNEIKGELRKRWGQLTNDDVQAFNGNIDQLVGLIQRKTGETRSVIENYLNQLTENGSDAIGAAAESARQYVQDAAQRIQDGSRQAVDTVRHSYEEAEEMVRRRPSESVAVCFGIGVFVGLLFGLTLRGR
jgi:uncharacterized protein YjbJ (UPF0337 family)